MVDLLNFDFEALKNVDIHTVDPDTLANLEDVVINPNDPQGQKLVDYLTQIKNPYLFRCGKLIVKLNYSDNDVSMEDKMKSYFNSL